MGSNPTMNQVIQYIFFFLIGTTLLNFAIALAARLKTQNKEFNQLIFYWTSLFITYGAVAALNDNPTQIAFAYFFQFIPAFIKTKVLRDSRGIHSNWKMFATVQAIGMILSAYMLTQTDLGFTISLLPVTFSTTLPYWEPVWNSLISHRKEANWIEKGISVVLFTAIINHFNYAFFRLDESAAWWGWSVSIAQYQCISIFLPLLINHRREVKERQKIQTAVEKISGHNTQSNETDELYQQLEIAISQKELFQTELQRSNDQLTEEREMNEILIRTISHDLANPLTVIGAYIEMLHAQKIPEAEKEKIWKRLKSNTQSALDMISRIRNAILTRSQASVVKIYNVSTDRSIKRLLDLFEEKIKEKNIKLNYVQYISLDTLVRAEESTLVEHVFSNILSNAIKFSHEGSEININVFETSNNVQIEFRDFGTGIKDSRLKQRVLVSTPGTKGEVGSGFGMMVLGYFLRQYGGTLNIKSKTEGPQKGTSAVVSLLKSQTTNARSVANANG
jgi:two-component system sensor histidine kinase/response regulator